MQNGQTNSHVARVLRNLGLSRASVLFQCFQARYHHGQQLQNNAGRDVGHDSQREDRKLKKCPTTEEVDQCVHGVVLYDVNTPLNRRVVDTWGRHDRTKAVNREQTECEQDFLAKIRGTQGVPESTNVHLASCSLIDYWS